MTPYQCVLADPPWKYRDKLAMTPETEGQHHVARSAEEVYRTVMTTDEICALGDDYPNILGQEIAHDAVLWLYVTCPFLLNGDGARVCRAWGFQPKQLWTWVKGRISDDAVVGALGMGHYMRVDTEHLILATRGHASKLVQSHGLRNYVIVEPKGEHSEKPEEMYALIEQLSSGPRVEFFARKHRLGWDAVGDELTD